MKELSLHILDIVQNSTRAGATEVLIDILEDIPHNLMRITIKDNGLGIKAEALATITDPFTTTRTTRRIGLGLALLKAAAEQCQGEMTLESQEGHGTTVSVTFQHDHIDRVPLGDIVSTLIGLIIGNPDIDFCYRHQVNDQVVELRTQEIKAELGDVPITDIAVVQFLTDYLQTHLDHAYKEAGVYEIPGRTQEN
ncbi:ATP-binding protein [candidate division KSB3 bacterium]|uniref:histidine kinase n=1 Tax=candidate division KSB3 bacterium TaxID=2044937 RepID=A0A9D5Q5J7_9BACT|nr:ATP-binding protein [candidate division KSB3 bacterium]MBD3324899.1 ATP-binding protein [candidate division KSB3 bacterium]